MASKTDAKILDTISTLSSDELKRALSVGSTYEMGQIITAQPALMNEFTSIIVEKLAVSLFSNKMLTNRLAKFKSGTIDVGAFIEEIWVDEVTGEQFDVEGTNPLTRKKPSVKVAYHDFYREYCYTVTITRAQVLKAFNTENGITSLMGAIIQSMYNGDSIDEYKQTKALIGAYSTKNAGVKRIQVAEVTDKASAEALIKKIKEVALDMTFPNKTYNQQKVTTFTDYGDMEIFVHKSIIPTLDVDLLANAFNMSKLDIEGRMTIVDDFGDNTDARVIIADKNALIIKDKLYQVETMHNGKGMFTNYFLHHHQLLSVSPFHQWVELTVATVG